MRSERVGSHIQRALSEIFKKKIKDPRLKMVVITGVRVSPDLKLARIFFTSTARDVSIRKVEEGLNTAKGYLKRTLAGTLGLRYMPELRFHQDQTFDYAENIESLLKLINTDNENDRQTANAEQRGVSGHPHQS